MNTPAVYGTPPPGQVANPKHQVPMPVRTRIAYVGTWTGTDGVERTESFDTLAEAREFQRTQVADHGNRIHIRAATKKI